MKNCTNMRLMSEQLPGPFVDIRYWVQWEAEDGTVREQQEKEKKFAYPGVFTAAGRPYTSWKQLCVKEDETGHLCRDIYGREVFAQWERFPCFDSYDYLYENRYYRWFFIRDNGRLTCVSYTDERKEIYVTEDVKKLNRRCFEAMKQLNWED